MKEIEILINDRCTKKEAEAYLNENRVVIFEAEDFEEHFEEYMSDWGMDEEDSEPYRRMITEGFIPADWGITTYEGQKYYIAYQN